MKKRVLLWILVLLMPAIKSQAQVVISQVYGGGGNSGAPYTHDFIELFNAGTAPASLGGLSLQYASATGTGNFGASASQLTELPNVTLQPGQYFLVQQGGNAAVGAPLPAPDFLDATPIAMAASAGKVVLVTGTTSLGCNGGSALCSPEAAGRILDLVGFGSANYFEGAGAAPAPSNTNAIFRAANGCTDTNHNAADFATGAPAPRNGSTPAAPCNGPGEKTDPTAVADAAPATVATGGPVLFTVAVTPGANPASTGLAVTGDLTQIGGAAAQPFYNDGTNGDATAGDNIFSYGTTVAEGTTDGDKSVPVSVSDQEGRTAAATASLTVQNNQTVTPIYAIQSSGAASPLAGKTVTTTGVVTGDYQGPDQLDGFYIQDVAGDGDEQTSDGVLVYVPVANAFSGVDVSVGDLVRLTGTVKEFGGLTEIDGLTALTIVSTNNTLPAPAFVTLPASLEPFEGMYVTFSQPLTVTENYNLGLYGELVLSANGKLVNPTNVIDPNDDPASGINYTGTGNIGAVTAQQALNNSYRIILDDASGDQTPNPAPYVNRDAAKGPLNTIRRGSTVNNLTGVLSYAFGSYRVQPVAATPPSFAYAPRPEVPGVGSLANLKVASMNVLNYFNGNGQGGGFPTPRGADNMVEFNRQRDKIIEALLGLDADVVGLMEVENDGDGELSAIKNLVDGLNARAGAGTYDYIRDPASGVGTDQIKLAIIFKPAAVTPAGAALSSNDPIFERSPVAQTFSLNNGEQFTLVVNHFKSKGSCPRSGDTDKGQGCWNLKRVEQAEALLTFIEQLKSTDEDVLAVGDFNAYEQEDPMDRLRAGGLKSLIENTYSYVFSGQQGSLDHALATPSLFDKFTGGGKWHINSDEPRMIDYDLDYFVSGRSVPKGDDQVNLYSVSPFKSSDHDPVLVGFYLFTPVVSFTESGVTRSEGSGAYTVTVKADVAPLYDLNVLVTVSSARDVRYGERRDYVTVPAPVENVIKVTLPGSKLDAPNRQQTVTFDVTPLLDDDNEKFPEDVRFTLAPAAGPAYKVGTPNTFTFTILDVKKNAELSLATVFTVWPNPTGGTITLGSSPVAESGQAVEVTLRSGTGELLYAGKGTLQQMSDAVSEKLTGNLPGFYMIQVATADRVQLMNVLKR